jgi:hypothetical protein
MPPSAVLLATELSQGQPNGFPGPLSKIVGGTKRKKPGEIVFPKTKKSETNALYSPSRGIIVVEAK